jgi:protein required for attachment to host cells
MSRGARVARARRQPQDRVWVVVADGGQARVLGVTGDRRGLTVLREMTSVDAHRRTQDLVSDRPGRSYESASPTRHAIAPRQDAHEQARERFVSQLALMLIEDNRARQFDELILIVAPGLSATLRDALDELKDLTKVPLHDIHDRLVEAGLLPPPADTP